MSDQPESTEPTEPDAADESPFLIDEELGAVSTLVGSHVPQEEPETADVADTTVATEVGTLGWPEGAENDPPSAESDESQGETPA